MPLKLPDLPKIQIKQDTRLPDESPEQQFDAMILIIDGAEETAGIQTRQPAWLGGIEADCFQQHPESSNPAVGSRGGCRIARLRVDKGLNAFQALSLARKTLELLLSDRPRKLAVIDLAADIHQGERMTEAIIAGLYAALYQPPRSGRTTLEALSVESLDLFGPHRAPDISRAEATAEGNQLARWLTQLPGNHLSPGQYRELAESLARQEGWDSHFYDEQELDRLGAGAFLSVTAASPNRDAGILRLSYRPAGGTSAPLALVGKGICFDTGGTNLKNASGMYGMHGDMQGSAVALGTLLALSRLKFPHAVDCWLALAENHIGSRATRPNDVVTALDGTTIEIVNTDAEGRMVLADTLALASRQQPRAILDYATPTGSCVAALGQRMSGAMSNRRDWVEALIRAGERSGERVWPLPWEADYDEDLESSVADVIQCRPPAEADHLYAARFLGRFVAEDIGWVHIDLSAGKREGGLAHVPGDVTGFGVRFGVEWLSFLDNSLIGEK